MTLAQYRAAEALEQHLGAPDFAAIVALDEREEFPRADVDRLRAWGYCEHLVPEAWGGRLASMEESAALQRAVSRRDLTTAIALGQTFLGSAAVWLAGSRGQRERLAAIVRGGGLCGLALTEEEHGSDVLASEVRAEGEKLYGRKWLINNGSSGAAWTVFARTAAEGGIGGFSLFLLEPGAGVSHLPRLRTHGLRGADISGLILDGAPASLIEPAGSGMDLALKTLQLTRTGCAQFSLGAADTALRVALDFAVHRKVYGGTVADIPHALSVLAGAYLDLLACDCLAIAATRGLHAAPAQMSLWSAVTKWFVPVTCMKAMRACAEILGARHYLREGPHAIFQKMLRDAAVVPLFDGSTAVNLDSIGVQLLRLSPERAAPQAERDEALRRIFSLREPLAGPLDATQLELMNAGRDDLTQGVREPRIAAALAQLAADVAALGRPQKRSAELFALAERHCVLSAAAACAHLWQHSREVLTPFFASDDGLAACIDRLLGKWPAPRAAVDSMLQQHRDGQAFSVVPLQLAGRSA